MGICRINLLGMTGKPMAPENQTNRPQAQKGHITDARGRRVSQLDPLALHLLHRNETIERDTLAKIVREKGIDPNKLEKISVVTVLLCIVAAIVILIVKYLAAKQWGVILKESVPMIYIFIWPFVAWGHLRKKRFGSIAAAMKKHLRCPHCGYDLRDLPVDENDGATVCPECGCAWKLTVNTTGKDISEHDVSEGQI